MEFSAEWSAQIDGVKLFEMMTTLCKEAQMRYRRQRIAMSIPKQSGWLAQVIEILERTKEESLRRKEA